MTKTYPQETVGTTLLEVLEADEHRRVYTREHQGYLEVAEFSRGPVTQVTYGSDAHLHAVHLPTPGIPDDIAAFFANAEPFLADYMDSLDAKHVPYGYLNSIEGKYVTYRPAR